MTRSVDLGQPALRLSTDAEQGHDRRLRHLVPCRAGRRNTGSSSIARVPVEVDIAVGIPLSRRRRCRRAAWRSSSRSRARPPIRWRRCATPRARASASSPWSTSRKHHRARGRRGAADTMAGPEIGVASTKAFTTQLVVLACLAIAFGPRQAARIDAARRSGGSPRRYRGAGARQRGAEPRRAHRELGAPDRRGARRALFRPRHRLSAGARGRAEAQGDLLHPRRGLCRRRDEARADRADRRQRAGDRAGAPRRRSSRRPPPTCRR